MCREILNMYKIMRNNCKSKRENLEFWDLSEWFALTEIKSIVIWVLVSLRFIIVITFTASVVFFYFTIFVSINQNLIHYDGGKVTLLNY